jgi:uncharacterized protein (DUF1697 family)
MAYWAALLRGINVGGRNKLAMADLRDLCSDLGLTDVSTYINSGNILFACDSVDGLVPRLEAEITKRFGLEIPIVVCSAERLESALAANPFAGEDPTKVLVYFCSRAVSPASASKIDGARSPDDSIAVLGTEVYLHLPDGVHKTKLTLGYLEKTLGVTMTSRNINTVEKLCSLNN